MGLPSRPWTHRRHQLLPSRSMTRIVSVLSVAELMKSDRGALEITRQETSARASSREAICAEAVAPYCAGADEGATNLRDQQINWRRYYMTTSAPAGAVVPARFRAGRGSKTCRTIVLRTQSLVCLTSWVEGPFDAANRWIV